MLTIRKPDGSTFEAESIEKRLWWQEKGLSYTASGYGKKIPTSQMIRVNNRWYRVYCSIHSNIGTCYILVNGDRWIVED